MTLLQVLAETFQEHSVSYTKMVMKHQRRIASVKKHELQATWIEWAADVWKHAES